MFTIFVIYLHTLSYVSNEVSENVHRFILCGCGIYIFVRIQRHTTEYMYIYLEHILWCVLHIFTHWVTYSMTHQRIHMFLFLVGEGCTFLTVFNDTSENIYIYIYILEHILWCVDHIFKHWVTYWTTYQRIHIFFFFVGVGYIFWVGVGRIFINWHPQFLRRIERHIRGYIYIYILERIFWCVVRIPHTLHESCDTHIWKILSWLC